MRPDLLVEASPFSAIDEVAISRPSALPTLVRARCSSVTAFRLPRPGPRWAGRAPAVSGAAVDLDARRATIRAAGEFWERYAASFAFADRRGLTRTRLEGRSVGLEEILAGDRCRGYAYELPDPEAEGDWVRGVDLLRGEPTWLPAEAVFHPYVDRDGQVEPHWAWTSNGLAAGATPARAAEAALLEVVERDAFMRHWLSRRPGRPIGERRWRSLLPPPLLEAVDACRPWRLRLALLASDGLPVVIAVAALVHRDRAPALTLAAACRFELDAAVRAAVLEVLHSRSVSDRLSAARPLEPAPSEPRDFEDRARLYGRPERLSSAIWLLGDDGAGAGEPGQAGTLRGLLRALDQQGLRAYAADLTTRDAAAAGFAVARVLVPGSQLLEADHRAQIVNRSRLRLEAGEANPEPHPFP